MAEYDEEERYALTKYGCLCVVCADYNINIDNLTAKMGEHFVDDLMKSLCKAGYVEEK